MTENYHTHTARCHHAHGTEEEYVISAVNAGLKVLGFSDHTPYFYDGDFVSPAKMSLAEMPDYFNTGLYLREKYKGKLDIRLGFETEYFPKFFDKLLREYRSYPLEYIILGQHVVGNESTEDAENAFTPTHKREILTRFADQCTEAMETGRFTYFAHPDCLNYVPLTREDKEFAASEHERLIRAAIRTETPLEINLCGVRHGRFYPDPSFWQLVGALGAPVVIGCDAHGPEEIAVKSELDFAERLIRDLSLNYIGAPPLKNPLF